MIATEYLRGVRTWGLPDMPALRLPFEMPTAPRVVPLEAPDISYMQELDDLFVPLYLNHVLRRPDRWLA